jgi:hypothetical protein
LKYFANYEVLELVLVYKYMILKQNIVAYLPQAGAVETQKPRNTQATIEERVFIAHCWATSSATINSPQSAPQPLLCNDSVNTFRQLRLNFLCGWRGGYITQLW